MKIDSHHICISMMNNHRVRCFIRYCNILEASTEAILFRYAGVLGKRLHKMNAGVLYRCLSAFVQQTTALHRRLIVTNFVRSGRSKCAFATRMAIDGV